MNIDEVIADARAEEEVKAEQEKSENNDFRDALRAKLKETFINRESATVIIPLHEYTELKSRSIDLDRIIVAIISGLKMGYSKDYLRLDDDLVLNTFRALYPDIYAGLFEEIQAETKEGE